MPDEGILRAEKAIEELLSNEKVPVEAGCC